MVGMVLARAATSMLPNSTTQLALSGYSILGQGLTEVRIKSVKLDASLGLLEDPSSVANDFEIHVENAFDKGVKCGENQNEEGWQNKWALNHALQKHDGNGKEKRQGPQVPGVGRKELIQSGQVIVEAPLQSCGDLDASNHEEEANTTNTTNQNMSREKAHEVAKLESSQRQENESRQDGA